MVELEGGLTFRLEDVKRLTLDPEDVLVVRAPDTVTAEQAEKVTQRLQALIPERRVIVLAPGWDLEATRSSV